MPVDEVLNDVLRAFHHPAARDEHVEIHYNMFATVRTWINEQSDAVNLNVVLGSASVKAGHNHTISQYEGGNSHNAFAGSGLSGSKLWSQLTTRDSGEMRNMDADPRFVSPFSPNETPQFDRRTTAYEVPPQEPLGTYLNPHPPNSTGYSTPFYAKNPPPIRGNQIYSYGDQYSPSQPPQEGFWQPDSNARQPSPLLGQPYAGPPFPGSSYDQGLQAHQYGWSQTQYPGGDQTSTQYPGSHYP